MKAKHGLILSAIMVFCLVVTGFVPSTLAQEGPTAAEYGVVLNLSGKQRMLTQKMSKEVLLIALDSDKEGNIKSLQATAALFDRTLKGLRDGDQELALPPTVSKRILRQLKKTAGLWSPFHAAIQAILAKQDLSAEDVKLIADSNLPLLKEMNRCVKLYEGDASRQGLKSDPGLAVTINLAGKQRMLTQKMSKEFLLVAYKHDEAVNRLNLRETVTLFDRTLIGLRDGDETLDLPGTAEEIIREQLAVVEQLWLEFKPLIEFAMDAAHLNIPGKRVQTLAADNIPLLVQMNKAVKLYEQEASN
jgi:hypothetical protein